MMDLTDEIDEFLKGKGISDGTARTQKSVLLTFNKWLVLMPHKDIREAGRAYRSALDERTGLKPKTVRTQASLVEDFCEWEASRLEGKPQNLLKPTRQRTASSRELERICRAALAQGDIGKRNASMALLSITCGLSFLMSILSVRNNSHCLPYSCPSKLPALHCHKVFGCGYTSALASA